MTQPAGKPLVAIVTPVYNGADFLAETMDSVQRQTYPNIVHVVQDNCSKDATPDIIVSFRDKRVPLIEAKTSQLLPMNDNWNAAIAKIPAEAEYFMFLCADDLLYPEAIERMVAIAEKDPSVMAVTCSVFWNEMTKPFGWNKARTIFEGDEAIRAYFKQEGLMDARIMLFRRTTIKPMAPFYDPSYEHSSDLDAALRAIAAGRMGFVHEPMAMAREHEDNASNREMRPLRIHFLEWLEIMRRYGPKAFGEEAHARLYRRYKRYYYRKLLVWRWLDGNKRAFDLHMKRLATMGEKPSIVDYSDALVDLALKRIGLRPGWYAYPG